LTHQNNSIFDLQITCKCCVFVFIFIFIHLFIYLFLNFDETHGPIPLQKEQEHRTRGEPRQSYLLFQTANIRTSHPKHPPNLQTEPNKHPTTEPSNEPRASQRISTSSKHPNARRSEGPTKNLTILNTKKHCLHPQFIKMLHEGSSLIRLQLA